MYLRRESARMPASTFQAYPVYPGDCREIKGPVLPLSFFFFFCLFLFVAREEGGEDDVPRHDGSNNRRASLIAPLDGISGQRGTR